MALALLLIALVFSAFLAYMNIHQAYWERGFSEAVWEEMGSWWVFNSIVSSFLPLAVALFSFFCAVKLDYSWKKLRDG